MSYRLDLEEEELVQLIGALRGHMMTVYPKGLWVTANPIARLQAERLSTTRALLAKAAALMPSRGSWCKACRKPILWDPWAECWRHKDEQMGFTTADTAPDGSASPFKNKPPEGYVLPDAKVKLGDYFSRRAAREYMDLSTDHLSEPQEPEDEEPQ